MRRNESEFLRRRREQLAAEKEKLEEEEALTALTQAAEHGLGSESGESESAMPRDLATAYYEHTSSWMHSFNDVRSDGNEFFILHEDNPDAWRMKVGDMIQDVSLNMIPYWEVVDNDQFDKKRVTLKPIGPNPFLTGRGAGGARITKEDIRVLTGEYEADRMEQIEEMLNSGKATDIDQVNYILAGTVPREFGPNGPQGGEYSATDTMSNRGGRKHMSPKEIVVHDAKLLRKLGFEVSDAAVQGEIPVDEWNQFVRRPFNMFSSWYEVVPTDPNIYMQRGMAALEEEGASESTLEWHRELYQAWAIAVAIVERDGVFSFEELDYETRYALRRIIAKNESIPEDMAREVVRCLCYITKWELFTTPVEHRHPPITLLNHPQDDVQMRAVARCIMHVMSSDDDDGCYDALLSFVRQGRGDPSVNYKIIEWAQHNLADDELLLAATQLPIGANKKDAYEALGARLHPYLLDAVFTEDDPQGFAGIANGLLQGGGYGGIFGGPKKFKGYLPGRHITYHLLEKLTRLVNEEETIYTRCDAHSALMGILQYARTQGFDVSEARAALEAYNAKYRHNPEEPSAEEDEEWLELVKEHMLTIVSD